jgi:NodT family efflux transporter outer membrane factor (OMF) lipoprotein
MRGLALLAAALALGACARTPPPSTAVQPLPPAFYFTSAEGLAPAEWWRRRLEDPALARLIEAALADAPDLAAAAARIEQARAGLQASQAEGMPLVSGSAGVTASRTSPNETGFPGGPGGPQIDRERIVARAGVEGSWDADLFGGLRADVRAARSRLDAARFDAAAVRVALVTDVARNFVAARAAAAREAIAADTVRAARDTLDVTRARSRAGLVPGIDSIRAEALLAETAAAVPLSRAERGARIAALAVLTGLAPGEIDSLVASSRALPRVETPSAGVPSGLLLRRPDVAAALARIAAADSDTAAALAARFPRLSITGAIGLVAAALGDIFSADALTGSAGASVVGPLADFGRNRARVARSRAAAAEAVALYRGTVLRAFGEVETALAAVEAGGARLGALDRRVAAAREAAEVARLQYRSGLTDFLPALEAERALNAARDQRAAAEAELADSQLALFRAIGGDYAPEAPAQSPTRSSSRR